MTSKTFKMGYEQEESEVDISTQASKKLLEDNQQSINGILTEEDLEKASNYNKKKAIGTFLIAFIWFIFIILFATSGNTFDNYSDCTYNGFELDCLEKADKPKPNPEPVPAPPLSPSTTKIIDTNQFIIMFMQNPVGNKNKYGKNGDGFTINQWQNPLYGLSIQKPVKGTLKSGDTIKIPNNFQKELTSIKQDIKLTYGFFEINNIFVKNLDDDVKGFKGDLYLDAHFSAFNITQEIYDKLKQFQETEWTKDSYLEWKDVKQYINSYARIVKFSVPSVNGVSDPNEFKQNSIQDISEGSFKDGELNGFGRFMNVFRTGAYVFDHWGCRVGFFNGSEYMWGKGIYWDTTKWATQGLKQMSMGFFDGTKKNANLAIYDADINDFYANFGRK